MAIILNNLSRSISLKGFGFVDGKTRGKHKYREPVEDAGGKGSNANNPLCNSKSSQTLHFQTRELDPCFT